MNKDTVKMEKAKESQATDTAKSTAMSKDTVTVEVPQISTEDIEKQIRQLYGLSLDRYNQRLNEMRNSIPKKLLDKQIEQYRNNAAIDFYNTDFVSKYNVSSM